MGIVIGISRYILPVITLVILIKCMLSLLLGHPKEKTYGYIIDALDGERYELNMWETSIGRSNSCDIVIGYDTVSRFQAVISRRLDGWYIYDLLSKAGIYVNGEKIEKKAMISGGDVLTFGNAQYRFEIADDPVQKVGKKKNIKNEKQPLGYADRANVRPQTQNGEAVRPIRVPNNPTNPATAAFGGAAPVGTQPPVQPPVTQQPPTAQTAQQPQQQANAPRDGRDEFYTTNYGYPQSEGTFSSYYYDDENRPSLHFEKKNESIFTQMPSEKVSSNDVYSNRTENEEPEPVVSERRYRAKRPTIFNKATGEAFVLSGNQVSIGRARSCDIQLDSPSVSKKHAMLVLYEDGWAIEDCGSYSGTFLSGNRVTEPQLLFDGDVIVLGDEKLYYACDAGSN